MELSRSWIVHIPQQLLLSSERCKLWMCIKWSGRYNDHVLTFISIQRLRQNVVEVWSCLRSIPKFTTIVYSQAAIGSFVEAMLFLLISSCLLTVRDKWTVVIEMHESCKQMLSQTISDCCLYLLLMSGSLNRSIWRPYQDQWSGIWRCPKSWIIQLAKGKNL